MTRAVSAGGGVSGAGARVCRTRGRLCPARGAYGLAERAAGTQWLNSWVDHRSAARPTSGDNPRSLRAFDVAARLGFPGAALERDAASPAQISASDFVEIAAVFLWEPQQPDLPQQGLGGGAVVGWKRWRDCDAPRRLTRFFLRPKTTTTRGGVKSGDCLPGTLVG